MKDANFAGTASFVRPGESASVSAGAKYLGALADAASVDGRWIGNNLESRASSVQSREKAFADGPTVADVGHHHRLLHRPSVVAIHESPKPFIAVVFTGRVGVVHRLAFNEQPILGVEDR